MSNDGCYWENSPSVTKERCAECARNCAGFWFSFCFFSVTQVLVELGGRSSLAGVRAQARRVEYSGGELAGILVVSIRELAGVVMLLSKN